MQTEDGENVGWLGRVRNYKAELECIKGREIKYGTTYLIVGEVNDYAVNETKIHITFTTLPDTQPPIIVDSTIQDGDINIDTGFLNNRLIEIWFSEEVEGNIELHTQDGENLHWSNGVQGRRVWLQRVSGVNRGKKVQDGITYVIIG